MKTPVVPVKKPVYTPPVYTPPVNVNPPVTPPPPPVIVTPPPASPVTGPAVASNTTKYLPANSPQVVSAYQAYLNKENSLAAKEAALNKKMSAFDTSVTSTFDD